MCYSMCVCMCVCVCGFLEWDTSVLPLPLSLQTVLQEAVAEGEREVVVCARHLVPDTNGFVDQLPSIRTLVACGHFILAVPLVGELRGNGRRCEMVFPSPSSGDRTGGSQ